jgi:hypothetical protein
MPAGATIKGEDGIIKIGGTLEIPMLTGWEFSAQADISALDTRVMKSNNDGGSGAAGGFAAQSLGTKSANFTATHQWQEDGDVGAQELLRTDDVGKSVTFDLYPRLTTSGKRKISGTALIASVGVASEVAGVITQTNSFTVDGVWTDTEIS